MAIESLTAAGPIVVDPVGDVAPPRRPTAAVHLRGPDALALAGAALWAFGLTSIRAGAMPDTGLIAVLPPAAFAGLAAFLSAFVWQVWRRPGDRWRMAAYVAALVVGLDGFPAMIESAASVPTGYIHAGFVDYILRHGTTLPNYDARMSWPGMFAWSALASVAGGQTNALGLLRWAPLALDLLYLAPLRLILRTLCDDDRTAWTAAVVFVLGNWVEQDYFSPQGLALLAYLTVLGVALSLSRRPAGGRSLRRAGAWAERTNAGATTLARRLAGLDAPTWDLRRWSARIGVTVALTVVIAAMASSHQLTPFTLIIELAVLLAFARLAAPTLLVSSIALTVGYLSLGAENFWIHHLSTIFGGVGQVSGSVGTGLVARTHVSVGHRLVVDGRLAYTAALLSGATVGILFRRRGTGRWLVAALAFAPWSLVAAQSYGGEVFLRSLFMSLPFLSVLVAEALLGLARCSRVAGPVGVAVALVAGSAALLLTRYGNEPFYQVTPSEISAVRSVDTGAAPGSLVAVLSQNLPWRFEDIEKFSFKSYAGVCPPVPDLACLRRVHADYVVLTAGQFRYAELTEGVPAAALTTLERVDLPAAGYRVSLLLPDATVYVRAGLAGVTTDPGGNR